MSELRINVTKIKDRWHARLMLDDALQDEMACLNRQDISWICREMLRWSDDTSDTSKWVDYARKNHTPSPIGKVWYQSALDINHGTLQK